MESCPEVTNGGWREGQEQGEVGNISTKRLLVMGQSSFCTAVVLTAMGPRRKSHDNPLNRSFERDGTVNGKLLKQLLNFLPFKCVT